MKGDSSIEEKLKNRYKQQNRSWSTATIHAAIVRGKHFINTY
jgi:hypothetical protein